MKAIGIILAGGNNSHMGELSKKRAVAAMPVAGSYRCIDFVLSNMIHSNIRTVGVLAQYNARSLNEHLSSSKWWDFGRKQGGLFVLNPTITEDNGSWYRGTADAMYQNINFLKKRHEPYVVITDGDCVYKMDYNRILDYHIEKKADITVVCKEMPLGEDVRRFGVVSLNETDKIIDFEEKPMYSASHMISAGIYVIRRRLLIELLERSAQKECWDFVRDILIRYKNMKQIYAYRMKEYWNNIATVESYYKTNMDFLKPDVRAYFFREQPEICSKADDLPPAKYNAGAVARNSLVSSGCIVNSRVEGSVLFKKVFVGKNCVIKNSVILNDVYIGDNTYIENCIVESRNTLKADSRYCGEGGIKVVSECNERYMQQADEKVWQKNKRGTG